jgi:hypothetical protein
MRKPMTNDDKQDGTRDKLRRDGNLCQKDQAAMEMGEQVGRRCGSQGKSTSVAVSSCGDAGGSGVCSCELEGSTKR